MTARLAWVLAALTFVAVVADVAVTAQYRNLFSEDAVAVHGFPFVDLAVLGGAVLGALILTQDRRHPIGLLLLLIGFTGAVSLLTEAYSIWVIDENGPGSRSVAGWSGWVSSLIGGQLSIAAIALIFLLAPDGRLLSTLAVRRGGPCSAAAPVRGGGAHPEPGGLRPQRPDRIGLLAGILASVGLPADQRRVARLRRLDGAPAATKQGRGAPAGAADRRWPRPSWPPAS